MPERYLSVALAPAAAPSAHSWTGALLLTDRADRAAHVFPDAFTTAPVLHALCGSRFKARFDLGRIPLAHFCPQCARLAASEGR